MGEFRWCGGAGKLFFWERGGEGARTAVPEWFGDEIKPQEEASETGKENGHTVFGCHGIVHNCHNGKHQEGQTTKTAGHESCELKAHLNVRIRAQK